MFAFGDPDGNAVTGVTGDADSAGRGQSEGQQ